LTRVGRGATKLKLMELDDHLAEIIRKAMSENRCTGALIYGSQIWGGRHLDSDVDLICLSPERGMLHFTASIAGVDVDLFRASEKMLRTAIRRKSKANDNFLLYACAEGIIAADDPDGKLQQLTALARKIWQRGPRVPGASERQRLRFAITRWMRTSALAGKTNGSDESFALRVLECDHIFFHCMQMYCRVKLLWYQPIWVLIRWKNARYRELQEICGRYLRARTLDEKIRLVRELAGLAETSLKWLRQSLQSRGEHELRRDFSGVWS